MECLSGSIGDSKIFLCRIPIEKHHISPHNMQSLYIAFPPLILPKKDAMIANGKTRIMVAMKSTHAYMKKRN
jgi:hypothetical protein